MATSMVDAFFDTWQTLARSALLTYNEPILPNATINIGSNNSSSPETERDVLLMASYGKQIGRISDAVEELIKMAPDAGLEAFKEFRDLNDKIAAVKKQALDRRADRMAADLLLMKATDGEQFERAKAAVLAALGISAPAGSPGSPGNGSPSPARRKRTSGAT